MLDLKSRMRGSTSRSSRSTCWRTLDDLARWMTDARPDRRPGPCASSPAHDRPGTPGRRDRCTACCVSNSAKLAPGAVSTRSTRPCRSRARHWSDSASCRVTVDARIKRPVLRNHRRQALGCQRRQRGDGHPSATARHVVGHVVKSGIDFLRSGVRATSCEQLAFRRQRHLARARARTAWRRPRLPAS